MKESVTYQAILEEGREAGREEGRTEEARRIVLLLGTARFGKPSQKVCRFLDRGTDRTVFAALIGNIIKVSSWAELLPELA